MGKPSKPRRRPVYSADLAAEICRRLTTGEALTKVCRAGDMPSEATVRLWALDDVEGFASQYARARMVGYLAMADGLLDISDNPEVDAASVNRDRLKVDTRKWLLSKALPKIYGDKLTAEVTGKDGGPIESEHSPLDLARRIAFLLTMGQRETLGQLTK